MRFALDPTIDVVFKLLFAAPASRASLQALLTAVLQPGAPIIATDVENPEIAPEIVDGKSVALDIHVTLADGRIIDVEMQAERETAFRERALFYWSRLFGAQLERGDPYEALRPVVSVLFLAHAAGTAHFHSTYRILEARDHSSYSDALEIHLIDLPKARATSREVERDDAKLIAWCRFLGAGDGAQDDEGTVDDPAIVDPMIEVARQRLRELSQDPAVRALAEARKRALYAARIEHAAQRAAGREEGREEGRASARREEILVSIAALAKVLGLEIGDDRRAALERLDLDELTRVRERLTDERRW